MKPHKKVKTFFNLLLGLILFWVLTDSTNGKSYFVGPIEPVPAIPMRPEWSRFFILIWQYRTNITRDLELYKKAGLHGFHIDRGERAEKLVELSLEAGFPYYVDHAADKGILHLRKEQAKDVTNQLGLITRPFSLADPQTIQTLKDHLKKNISTTKNGLVLAYAFDDEISLGHYVAPGDVDIHPHSLAWFREWLKWKYKTIAALNKQWEKQFQTFDDVMPSSFEEVRGQMGIKPINDWNLSPWMDFRQFMDDQFSIVLKELTMYSNQIDPKIPAGFVGGQAPSPWGGYDYAKISRSVQWMEAYDIHGTDEILRSFWNRERRPRMHTFFSKKNYKLDSWFLWYYLVHGNQAMIAWPEGWFHTDGNEIAPHILGSKLLFDEVQGMISEFIIDQKAKFEADPIGIYYSHPSIQAGWAVDALPHGKRWTKRSSSIDNDNQTKGILRKAWFKLLEDLGFQYEVISYLDVEEGRIDLSRNFKVVILPKTICLSKKEGEAFQDFVKKGGTLIADNLCGVMDEHGKGRSVGALDEMFGIIRDGSKGYLNGKGLTEIDGEKYQRPFLDRFSYYEGAYRYRDIVVFERGTRGKGGKDPVKITGSHSQRYSEGPSVLIENRFRKGQTFYLNLSFVEYWDSSKRFGEYGKNVRGITSEILKASGLKPRITILENGSPDRMIESIFWRREDQLYLCLVKNPSDHVETGRLLNGREGILGNKSVIKAVFRDRVKRIINLRTGRDFGEGREFEDQFKPWEANIYQIEFEKKSVKKIS